MLMLLLFGTPSVLPLLSCSAAVSITDDGDDETHDANDADQIPYPIVTRVSQLRARDERVGSRRDGVVAVECREMHRELC
jgi:hypothetical protein